MERQRHTKDIAHPIYEIIDNASSAGVGYGGKQYYTYIFNYAP